MGRRNLLSKLLLKLDFFNALVTPQWIECGTAIETIKS